VIREFWYEQEGKGSYSYKPDVDLAAGAAETSEPGMEIVRGEDLRNPREPAPAAAPAPKPEGKMMVEHERGQEAPQLTRELKALLKLLVRKGLITQQEYMDAFKET
jgi:hypothetical protein